MLTKPAGPFASHRGYRHFVDTLASRLAGLRLIGTDEHPFPAGAVRLAGFGDTAEATQFPERQARTMELIRPQGIREANWRDQVTHRAAGYSHAPRGLPCSSPPR
ncbi:MAG: hypothetical protein R3C70_18250 [Geminicoccaceae bacterium]